MNQTEGRRIDLKKAFDEITLQVSQFAIYHNSRALFFRRWNLALQIFDWGLGTAVVYFGLYSSFQYGAKKETIALAVAGVAILLLFISILFDLSQKAEKHRWLTYTYQNLKNEVAICKFINWGNLNQDDRKEYKNKYCKLQEEIAKLIKEEYPMLKFLKLVSKYDALQEMGQNVDAISKLPRFQSFLMNVFSMPVCTMKFQQERAIEANINKNGEQQQKSQNGS